MSDREIDLWCTALLGFWLLLFALAAWALGLFARERREPRHPDEHAVVMQVTEQAIADLQRLSAELRTLELKYDPIYGGSQ